MLFSRISVVTIRTVSEHQEYWNINTFNVHNDFKLDRYNTVITRSWYLVFRPLSFIQGVIKKHFYFRFSLLCASPGEAWRTSAESSPSKHLLLPLQLLLWILLNNDIYTRKGNVNTNICLTNRKRNSLPTLFGFHIQTSMSWKSL